MTPADQAEIAIAYLKDGHFALAQQEFNKALAADPHNFRALYGLGTMDYQQSRYPVAIPYLRRAVAVAPHDVEPALTLGACYQKSGNAAQANAIYQQILKQDPKNARALFNLGDMNIDLMRYPVARQYFEKILTVAPTSFLAADSKTRIRQIDQYFKGTQAK